jgi:hypothetical protein
MRFCRNFVVARHFFKRLRAIIFLIRSPRAFSGKRDLRAHHLLDELVHEQHPLQRQSRRTIIMHMWWFPLYMSAHPGWPGTISKIS